MSTSKMGPGYSVVEYRSPTSSDYSRYVEDRDWLYKTMDQQWRKCMTPSISTGRTVATGSKPVVVCNGQMVECDDLAKAQEKAEALAHQNQTEAYILKPVKKVAPKREVVTTDLE